MLLEGGISSRSGGPGGAGLIGVEGIVGFKTKGNMPTGLGISRTSLLTYGTVLTSSYVQFNGIL